MARNLKMLGNVILGLLFVIGWRGLPGDILGWGEWLANLASYLDKNVVAYGLMTTSVVLIMVINFGPQLLERLKGRSLIQLLFEDNEGVYHFVGEQEGSGMEQGRLQIYRLGVKNPTSNVIEGVEVVIMRIEPVMPPTFTASLPFKLHFTQEGLDVTVMDLSPQQMRLVDLVSYFDKLWNCYIKIGHTDDDLAARAHCSYDGRTPYIFEVTATAKNTKSVKRKFLVKVEDYELKVSPATEEIIKQVANHYRSMEESHKRAMEGLEIDETG